MDELPEEEKPGIPAWVVTFADLMSLLMCFFVLLLSFSEIDAQKFKQIAGELSKAFGVQREVPALEIPEGTSPIFDKFSPAPPEPTVLNEVRQTTTEEARELDIPDDRKNDDQAEWAQELQADMSDIEQVLAPALETEQVDLALDGERIIIRIEEKGSFGSGSAELSWELEGLLLDMAQVLGQMPGDLAVEGHTDNVPIRTDRFQSNWDLSAARAAAVANVLVADNAVTPDRLRVTGFADTRPRFDNTSPENRAKNRRVEIIIDRSAPVPEEQIRLMELIDAREAEDAPVIDLRPGNTSSGTQNDISW